MSKYEAVAFVLGRFVDMGATVDQLYDEAERLENDEAYLNNWVSFFTEGDKCSAIS